MQGGHHRTVTLKTILDVIWRDAGMVDGNLYDLSHN
jgi:hypothetical protein